MTKEKKARYVCNGSPNMTGTVTLVETYTGSLDQVASKVFWAAVAINNFIVIVVDTANAFAEAGAPKTPPFVTVDTPFRECISHDTEMNLNSTINVYYPFTVPYMDTQNLHVSGPN